MSRSAVQHGDKIAREVLAEVIAHTLRGRYLPADPDAQVTSYETNGGLQQIRLQFGNGVAYHVTVTKARS